MEKRRKRQYRDIADYELVEGDDPSVLKDGQRMRVPMFLADGVTLDDHQPGPRRTKDQAALDAKEAAYRERALLDETAWMPEHMRTRTPPSDPAAQDRAGSMMTDARDRAYAVRDWEDANSWRGQTWLEANRPANLR